MVIGITGATGQLGTRIATQLKAHIGGDDIVGLVRTPAKATMLGIQARRIDYDDISTLEPALDGIDMLMLVSSSEIGQREQQHGNVIRAAKQSGVSRIVYTSLLRADTSMLSVASEHKNTEAAIHASGLDFTILRNGWYTENYLASAQAAAETGILYGVSGSTKRSAATRNDYAQAAVAALVGNGHNGRTYELAGSKAFTLPDLAEEIGRQAGHLVRFVELAEQDYANLLRGNGIPDQVATAIASWEATAGQGALFSESNDLQTLIGRPTTSLAQAVADHFAHPVPS